MRAQVLLELDALRPTYSVLPPSFSFTATLSASLADVLSIARNAVAALPSPPSNGTGRSPFAADSIVANSFGIASLLPTGLTSLAQGAPE